MRSRLLQDGGPHAIRHLGGERYSASVSLPDENDGLRGRECPDSSCAPGFFKVRPGTGIVEDQTEAFCPYCRHRAAPDAFNTAEQLRYARESLEREVLSGAERMLAEALGLRSGRRQLTTGAIAISMEMKATARPAVARPRHEELRRDVRCPHCGLDHAVFGLAIWCADCGADIFLTHVDAEFAVIGAMLDDVERRREILGARVAAKDLENCLEDTVSVHEAVLRVFARRMLALRNIPVEEVDKRFKRLGSGLQNVRRAQAFFQQELALDPLQVLTPDLTKALERTFLKRHPITHNLGVVDRQYLRQVDAGGRPEGREVRITADEIREAIAACQVVFAHLYQELVIGPSEPQATALSQES